MNKLSVKERAAILNCLSEGMGINGTSRVTGASKNTVLKLLCDVGAACAAYQDRVMRGLHVKRLECDELFSFVGAKQKNVKAHHPGNYGDCYTFTAIDPDTKLMPCWLVGTRDTASAVEFMADLAQRIEGRFQLTTDAFRSYIGAVESAFGSRVDYAMVDKDFAAPTPAREAARRYQPTKVVNMTKVVVSGNPDPQYVSTSLVERSNLSIRMSNRRFARLTNAFSKKMVNHMHAVSFYFMVYNFVKVHGSIKTTPAMEAGVTTFLWTMEDIVVMAETNA